MPSGPAESLDRECCELSHRSHIPTFPHVSPHGERDVVAFYEGWRENSRGLYHIIRYKCDLDETYWDNVGKCSGGEGGIRTREKLAPLRDFQSRPFVHSGTSPRGDDAVHYRFGLGQPQVCAWAVSSFRTARKIAACAGKPRRPCPIIASARILSRRCETYGRCRLRPSSQNQ